MDEAEFRVMIKYYFMNRSLKWNLINIMWIYSFDWQGLKEVSQFSESYK